MVTSAPLASSGAYRIRFSMPRGRLQAGRARSPSVAIDVEIEVLRRDLVILAAGADVLDRLAEAVAQLGILLAHRHARPLAVDRRIDMRFAELGDTLALR